MKKLLLAAFVVATFVLYSLNQHNSGSTPVLPPVSAGQKSSGTSTANATTSLKDGQYTGSAADALYGNIQVKAVIQGGKITDVQFLQYPSDRSNSVRINQQAMPYLTQEAITAQSSQVDIISGATDTSYAFIQSLASALTQAQS